MCNQGRVKKSIYLDWNVFQDIIQNRKSERLRDNLDAATRKGFIIPYSHAHMSDLARCGNAEYVNSDLQQIEIATRSMLVGELRDKSGFGAEKISINLVYDSVKRESVSISEAPKVTFTFAPYKVERSRLSKENVIIPYLDRFNGEMCPALMECFLQETLEGALSDYTLQRGFRNSFVEVVRLGDPACEKMLEMPFYKYLLASREEIEQSFLEILESFLNVDGKTSETVEECEKFTTAYGILDFFPVFKEKIEKRNNLNNILTDALHVFIASKCSYFVCGDGKLVEKAKLLYRVFGVPTKVYEVNEFIKRVEF